ncbi:MAG: 3-hydroxyacyl-ACP dehydratase FabZ [Rhizobiaceae bacterium]
MAEVAAGGLETLDIAKIMELIPHRYPFLLIDKIIDVDGDNSAVGVKNVTVNEPFFVGHFPGNPVMPGVLIIEAMAQTAGAICAHAHVLSGGIVYFMTIDAAKFRRPVVPGDQLRIRVAKQKQRRNIWKFACEAKVDGRLVAEATISAMIGSGEGAKPS